MCQISINFEAPIGSILSSEQIKESFDDHHRLWPQNFVQEGAQYALDNGSTIPAENSWRSNTAQYMYPTYFVDVGFDEGMTNYKENVYNKERAWNQPPNIASHLGDYCWCEYPNSPEYSMTNVMTITGEDTITDALRKDAFPTDIAEIEKIRDLIVCVEVNHSGVHWMRSGDLDVEKVPEDFTNGTTGFGVTIVFLDAGIWFIDHKCPLENVKTFMTLSGARENDRDVLLKPYCLLEFDPEKTF